MSCSEDRQVSAQGQGAHGHGEAGEGPSGPLPPATAPCPLHPLRQATPLGGPWLVLFDFLGDVQKARCPAGWLCARKAGLLAPWRQAVRCGQRVCREVPLQPPRPGQAVVSAPPPAGPTPRLGLIQEWTRCANGRGGREAQTPHVPVFK